MAFHTTSLPLRILHLEDSVADHELTCMTLRRAGMAHTVQQVDTLDAFRNNLCHGAFDLILADYNLPGFTAMDAWALVSGETGHPPFILCRAPLARPLQWTPCAWALPTMFSKMKWHGYPM